MSFRDLFSFSKTEKRGVYVLLIIILLQIVVLSTMDLFKESKPIDFSDFEKQIDAFYKSSKQIDANVKSESYTENQLNSELFNFDPNSTSVSDWKKLGFSDKQIAVITNYINKGGKFYKKEDLAKIYVISEEQYKRVENYITINDNRQKFETNNKTYEKESNVVELFDFDPNKTSPEKMLKLGLSQKQINVINNFLSKGGKFYKKEDFKKIYSISATQYEMLEPYIKIENINEKKYSSNVMVEINSADSIALLKLNGIGPSFVKRILKYRSMIGGFYKKEQLMEVYGLTQEVYNKIQTNINIDETMLVKININKATVNEINAHPYIDFKLAKAIVEVRGFNGEFSNVEDLKTFKLVDEATFLKIKNYLCVN